MIAKQTEAHFELFIDNPEWNINEVTSGRSVVTYECCPEPYVNVQYNVTIERRSSIYRTVILAPAFVIILLTLLTFLLPAQYGEKILLNGVTALIIVLFLLYFSQKINVMASHTPLVGEFFEIGGQLSTLFGYNFLIFFFSRCYSAILQSCIVFGVLFNTHRCRCNQFNPTEASQSITVHHKEEFGWKIRRNASIGSC